MATVEARNKNHWMTKATHVLQRKLRKDSIKDSILNRSVHEFYRLKALITLEQVNNSVVEKTKEES